MRRAMFERGVVVLLVGFLASSTHGAVLTGRVTDERGRAIAATVSLVDVPWGWEPVAQVGANWPSRVLASATATPESGFAIDASELAPSFPVMRIEAEGRAPLLRSDERVVVGQGALPRDLDLPLPPGRAERRRSERSTSDRRRRCRGPRAVPTAASATSGFASSPRTERRCRSDRSCSTATSG